MQEHTLSIGGVSVTQSDDTNRIKLQDKAIPTQFVYMSLDHAIALGKWAEEMKEKQ